MYLVSFYPARLSVDDCPAQLASKWAFGRRCRRVHHQRQRGESFTIFANRCCYTGSSLTPRPPYITQSRLKLTHCLVPPHPTSQKYSQLSCLKQVSGSNSVDIGVVGFQLSGRCKTQSYLFADRCEDLSYQVWHHANHPCIHAEKTRPAWFTRTHDKPLRENLEKWVSAILSICQSV